MKTIPFVLFLLLHLFDFACADCFVADALECSSPERACDTFCYRDAKAYYADEIGEHYFGGIKRKGDVFVVWYDSADYEGVIDPPDTETFVRHNDTVVPVFSHGDVDCPVVNFIRIDASDESIPFFTKGGDETIGRCETLKKKRRKSSRLKSACDNAKVCCFKSNADDTLCIRDSSAFFYARMSFSVGYGHGRIRYRDEYLMLLQDASCGSAECQSDTLFFMRLGDTLVLDHEVYPSLKRSFKSRECRFYLPVDSFPAYWRQLLE